MVEESDDEYDSDVEESEDEEEEEEEVAPAKSSKSKLASSAVKASAKAQSKKTAAAKKVIASGLAETATTPLPKRKKSLSDRIPYIIRASLNPVTLFAMTKAYFASLFNLEYGRTEEPSQDLRSALEAKAKKAAGGGNRGKRKMKPGQAKTIGDLPALNT